LDGEKVTIIGAGIGGLAVGSLLSIKGISVQIFEKSETIGGRATSYNYKDCVVDNGVHLLPMVGTGSLSVLLKETGADNYLELLEGGTPWILTKDGDYRLPEGPAALSKFELLPLEERLTFGAIMIEVAGPDFNFKKIDDKSLKDYVDGFTKSRELHSLFNTMARWVFISKSYEKVSAGAFFRLMKEALISGKFNGYPAKGGFIEISNALRKVIEENGGKIRLKTEVKEIIVNEKVKGLRLISGEKISSDIVVFTPRVQTIYNFLEKDHFSKKFRKKVEKLKPQMALSLIFCLKKHLREYKSALVLPGTNIVEIWEPTNLNRTIAPEGKHLAYVVSPIEEGEDWEEQTEKVINDLQERFPKIMENSFWKIEKHHDENSPAFGVQVAVDQFGSKNRPSVKSDDIKGMFFVGDTVDTYGAGTNAVALSAFECAEKILGEKYNVEIIAKK